MSPKKEGFVSPTQDLLSRKGLLTDRNRQGNSGVSIAVGTAARPAFDASFHDSSITLPPKVLKSFAAHFAAMTSILLAEAGSDSFSLRFTSWRDRRS